MEYLRGDAQAQALLPTATRYLDLQDDIRQLDHGGLLKDSNICQFTDGTLILGVKTPSIASKLRQTLPRLCEGLLGRGWKVNAIQLRVQPGTFQEKSNAWSVQKGPKGVPAEALTHWRELILTMEDSPLKDAISALIAHQRAA
jgi:hypothetical protein